MMKRRKKRIEDKRLEKRTRTRQECMYLHLVPLVRMLLSCQYHHREQNSMPKLSPTDLLVPMNGLFGAKLAGTDHMVPVGGDKLHAKLSPTDLLVPINGLTMDNDGVGGWSCAETFLSAPILRRTALRLYTTYKFISRKVKLCLKLCQTAYVS